MKIQTLLILVLLVGGGYAGYRFQRARETERLLRAQIDSLQQEQEARQRAPTPAAAGGTLRRTVPNPHTEAFVDRQIPCTFCGGDGWVPLRTGTQRMAQRYGCPVCGAVGFRVIRMPENAETCPNCRGMGRIPVSSGGARHRAAPCTRCTATGWIMPAR